MYGPVRTVLWADGGRLASSDPVAGRALAGRSPARAGPPTPQAAGVPVSRDKSCNPLEFEFEFEFEFCQ